MGKIEKFYTQKKVWKVQEINKKGIWKDILDGKCMRHGEANIFVKSAKLLNHPKLRIVKGDKC